eukprot:CAMPEP_0172889196 /NCGR_PEP_ID=MMETSP1075-20121228/138228_1 /TAXON_ID=2916 /ORGANISM="Ceratium fusus, Strain PA161109" /LENGTH=83 /DNA_ID=CAMNT_0013743201 /DNA_START=19 /DNA_END=270 /DNA_ORIENTATION=-
MTHKAQYTSVCSPSSSEQGSNREVVEQTIRRTAMAASTAAVAIPGTMAMCRVAQIRLCGSTTTGCPLVSASKIEGLFVSLWHW